MAFEGKKTVAMQNEVEEIWKQNVQNSCIKPGYTINAFRKTIKCFE